MANTSDEPEAIPPTTPEEETAAPASKLDSIVNRIDSEDPAKAQRQAKLETAAPIAPKPAPRRGGGFFAMFLGGVCAAALGFAAAIYVLPKVPQEWLPFPLTDTTARDAQTARIKTMAEDIARLQQAPAPVDKAALDAELTRLRDEVAARPAATTDIGPLETRLTDLEARLTALEKRPVAGGAASSTAIDALSRELEALRSQVTQQAGSGGAEADRITAAATEAEAKIKAATDEAAKLKAEAEGIARQAKADSALRLMQAALESGAPFTAALEDLTAAGIEVPAELQQDAQGIPTLDELRTSFPEAAREALSVTVQPAPDAGALDRLGAFLRGQTGARSLTPREGNDPDAILSRAEAALNQGDLAAALSELRALPVEVQGPMTDWIKLAEKRLTALEAAAVLSAKMN